jgi:hypothetical protein
MLRVVVPFLLAAALTGCATTEPGTATPGGQTSTGPTTGTSSKSAPVNRPKAVDLKTVDPCTLVSPETKAALRIRTVQPAESDKDFGDGSKACGTSYEDHKYTWGIDTLVNGGVDRLKRTTGEDKLTQGQSAGYPTYLTKGPSQATKSPQCEIYLDVNDEQLLLVSVIGGWGEAGTTEDGACERAKPLADAVANVLAK